MYVQLWTSLLPYCLYSVNCVGYVQEATVLFLCISLWLFSGSLFSVGVEIVKSNHGDKCSVGNYMWIIKREGDCRGYLEPVHSMFRDIIGKSQRQLRFTRVSPLRLANCAVELLPVTEAVRLERSVLNIAAMSFGASCFVNFCFVLDFLLPV